MADTTLQIIGGMFGRECCVVPCTAVATPDSLRTSEQTTSCDTGHAVEHREPIPMQAPWRATELGRRTRLWVNARSAIDTVVDLLRPPHIWLPSYLCPSLVHAACDRLHIEPSFYAIDESLQIADRGWLDHLHRGDLVVFVSYFGFPFDERDAQAAQERGAWVLEQVLGEHVPPPPANVPALEKQDQKKVANMTLRQRTELHRTNPVCASCHKVLDPIGFGLENFDAIGRWREKDDSGGAIDAAGELPGGKSFSSPKELKAIIAARHAELARNLTEKMLAYALGRQLAGYDEIVVDRIAESLAKDGYRMQTLVSEIVECYPFLNRQVRDQRTANAK